MMQNKGKKLFRARNGVSKLVTLGWIPSSSVRMRRPYMQIWSVWWILGCVDITSEFTQPRVKYVALFCLSGQVLARGQGCGLDIAAAFLPIGRKAQAAQAAFSLNDCEQQKIQQKGNKRCCFPDERTIRPRLFLPRLRECCSQVEAEVVSNSKNKVH